MATLPLCNVRHPILPTADRKDHPIHYLKHSNAQFKKYRNAKLIRLSIGCRNARFITRSVSVNGVSVGKSAEDGEIGKGKIDVELVERIRRWIGFMRSVLPGGSWWWSFSDDEVIVSGAKPVSLWRALCKMWELVSKDRWVIFAAFSALIITAVSMCDFS